MHEEGSGELCGAGVATQQAGGEAELCRAGGGGEGGELGGDGTAQVAEGLRAGAECAGECRPRGVRVEAEEFCHDGCGLHDGGGGGFSALAGGLQEGEEAQAGGARFDEVPLLQRDELVGAEPLPREVGREEGAGGVWVCRGGGGAALGKDAGVCEVEA